MIKYKYFNGAPADLWGSSKQINWAEEIRKEKNDSLKKAVNYFKSPKDNLIRVSQGNSGIYTKAQWEKMAETMTSLEHNATFYIENRSMPALKFVEHWYKKYLHQHTYNTSFMEPGRCIPDITECKDAEEMIVLDMFRCNLWNAVSRELSSSNSLIYGIERDDVLNALRIIIYTETSSCFWNNVRTSIPLCIVPNYCRKIRLKRDFDADKYRNNSVPEIPNDMDWISDLQKH